MEEKPIVEDTPVEEDRSELDDVTKDEDLDEPSSEDDIITEDIPTDEKIEEPQNELPKTTKNTSKPGSELPGSVDKTVNSVEEEKVGESTPERQTQDAKVYTEKNSCIARKSSNWW